MAEVMGIINITEDSYFSQSRVSDEYQFEQRLNILTEQGVDIIDIGACSTRPGSIPIDEEQEWERIRLALLVMKKYPDTKLSIDTFRSGIVKRSYDIIGDFMVNDISSGEDDPDMLNTVSELNLPYIAMHKRGTPESMNDFCSYENVTLEVKKYFEDIIRKTEALKITNLYIDPGFGFSKTIEQNYELLSNLDLLKSLNKKILIGISRKSMIYKLLKITPEESLPATSALHLFALTKGADILRVHDVKEAKEIISLYLQITHNT